MFSQRYPQTSVGGSRIDLEEEDNPDNWFDESGDECGEETGNESEVEAGVEASEDEEEGDEDVEDGKLEVTGDKSSSKEDEVSQQTG